MQKSPNSPALLPVGMRPRISERRPSCLSRRALLLHLFHNKTCYYYCIIRRPLLFSPSLTWLGDVMCLGRTRGLKFSFFFFFLSFLFLLLLSVTAASQLAYERPFQSLVSLLSPLNDILSDIQFTRKESLPKSHGDCHSWASRRRSWKSFQCILSCPVGTQRSTTPIE